MNFRTWLATQTDRQDSVGDFARDTFTSIRWGWTPPDTDDLDRWKFHLMAHSACGEALDALTEAHNEFNDELMYRDYSIDEMAIGTGRSGYVYVMHAEGTKWFKIGKSKQPQIRKNQLSAKAPFRLGVMKLIATADMTELESYLHEVYQHQRVRGEWFVLEPMDLEYIGIAAIGMSLDSPADDFISEFGPKVTA